MMVGDKLAALLEERKIKAGTLAARTGIPKSTIYSILRRNNKNVGFSIMEKIAEYFCVPVEYFYDSDEKDAENKKEPITGSDGQEENEDIDIEITEWDKRYLAWLHSQSPEKRRAILILQDAPEDLL